MPGSYTSGQLAKHLGVTEGQVRSWRRLGNGPPFSIVRRKVYYSYEGVEEWLLTGEFITPKIEAPENTSKRRAYDLLLTKDAAVFLGSSISTLQMWRLKKTGPKFTRIGNRTYYKREDLEAFKASGWKPVPQRSKYFVTVMRESSHPGKLLALALGEGPVRTLFQRICLCSHIELKQMTQWARFELEKFRAGEAKGLFPESKLILIASILEAGYNENTEVHVTNQHQDVLG